MHFFSTPMKMDTSATTKFAKSCLKVGLAFGIVSKWFLMLIQAPSGLATMINRA